MTTIHHIGTDQNWQDETTIQWYEVNGEDYGTGIEFEDDVYGVSDCNGETEILDCYGCPLTESDYETIAVRNALKNAA